MLVLTGRSSTAARNDEVSALGRKDDLRVRYPMQESEYLRR